MVLIVINCTCLLDQLGSLRHIFPDDPFGTCSFLILNDSDTVFAFVHLHGGLKAQRSSCD